MAFEEFKIGPLTEKSNFVIPFRINYRKNGINRTVDGVKSHSDVSILIYNQDRKSLVLVKQLRPVVYYVQLQNISNGDNPPEDFGYTLELCAGIVDKPDLSLEEIAAAEVHEECGYRVDPSRLNKFSTVITNERLTAASGCIYYLEVGDNDLDSAAGGGNADDGECIEVVYWPIDRIDELLTLTETKTHVSDITVLAVLWFQLHILPSL
ncbi:unnamed protein product [Hymenolepis diminuta]|uniref:Uridine diphosphate glucose pyrophosphatase NUDT14 n=1 Tax=Hymenolepis diminuta TaxID=6216 RepID=A0A564YRG0_HYMDI|nr:unnamed protein product [Hymenolepis diminuta]